MGVGVNRGARRGRATGKTSRPPALGPRVTDGVGVPGAFRGRRVSSSRTRPGARGDGSVGCKLR